MKFQHLFLVCLIIYVFFSCKGKDLQIKHIPYLTEIDTINTGYKLQNNRKDYFVIYNFNDSKKANVKVNAFIKSYSDSFIHVYDNYAIFLYKDSKFVDTSYIKKMGPNYYYKALLDVKPNLTFQWWQGRLISSTGTDMQR